MLISRGLALPRTINLLKNLKTLNNVSVRNSHAAYRYRDIAAPASKGIILTAEIVGGFAWWWILWHFYTDYERVTGEFEYPDPSKWSDEELGIPTEGKLLS